MDEVIEVDAGAEALAVAQDYVEQALSAQQATITMDEIIAQMGRNPLPEGYISMSMAPNHKMRRLAQRRTRRLMNRMATWKRTLIANGINPEDVVVERRKKRGVKPKPTPRTRTTTHNERRKAAQGRKHAGLTTGGN